MGILDKIIQKKEEQPVGPHNAKPMLALSISAGVVKATIWELKDHTIEIIGLGVKNYSDSGKETNPDHKTISEKAADAIDIACQVAEVDVKDTIFGLPQSWIVDEEILPQYDELTTLLSKNLDLEAVAYVSIPHALSYYLQYLHKTPPTAILIGSSREGAQIAYVENGKIKEHTYVQWSGGSLGKNIDSGLMKFTTMPELPATIFLYGFGDLTTARDELQKYDWSSSERLGTDKKAPTSITSPKIVVLEEHADSLAVALVGAKDYARHNNIHGRLSIKSLEYASMNTQAAALPEHPLPAEQKPDPMFANLAQEPHTASDVPFGFVKGVDIVNGAPVTPKLHQEPINRAPESTEENPSAPHPIDHQEPLHQHEDEGATDDAEDELEEQQMEHSERELDDEEAQQEEEQPAETPQKPWHERPKPTYKLRPQFSKPKVGISAKNARQMLYIGLIVLALVLIGGSTAAWAYWNVPKATVTVYVKPDNLEKQITITASEKITSVENNSIPAQKISIELKDTRDTATTGKRTTGQVAKGEVTITNKTGSSKNFASGTELRANNLKFTLSESVTVASASATTTADGETKTYGKANVKVTATDIGPEGNLEKDTSFAIAGFTKDDYEAIAAATFSGGSKKDIKVVSANDRTNLARDLHADMQLKVPEQIRAKVGSDDVLLDKAWQIDSTTDKFNKAVNDETDTLTLETTIKASAFTFKKADVEKLLAGVANTAVPDGYEIKDNTSDVRTDFVSLGKDGVLTLTAVSRVSIIPKIDGQSIVKQIIGKQEDAARKTILDNNKIYDVSFEYSTRLPEPLMTLPHKEENITVNRGVR